MATPSQKSENMETKSSGNGQESKDHGIENKHLPGTRFVFGTYKLKGEVLSNALDTAVRAFSETQSRVLIDTAVLYRNDKEIVKCMEKYRHVLVGSKIGHSSRGKITIFQ